MAATSLPYITGDMLNQGNQGRQGMDPLIGQGIIGGINSLIQGFLSGAGKKKRQKTAMRLWKEMADIRMKSLQANVRPPGQYQDFSQDPVMQQAIAAMLQNRMGEGFFSSRGIDLAGIGQTPRVPQAQARYVPQQTGYRDRGEI